MLLLCDSIVKKEISSLKEYFSLEKIKDAARKAKNGLGQEIKGSKKKNTRLIKVYLTGKRGAGRIVFVVITNKGMYIPVVLRLKKEKEIGENMTIQNKKFEVLLEKNLDMIFDDIHNKAYETIEL